MGSLAGSAVTERRERNSAAIPGYERLDGAVPVFHPPGMEERAAEVRDLLETGAAALADILDVASPKLEALLVADADWREAPREHERPYPPGLPYLTQSVKPPVLVLPETLSPAFRPRTGATWPLVVWHELAHAFLLQKPVPRAPAWLREFVPQSASAAVALREGFPLGEHLSRIEEPGFTVRSFEFPASAEDQISFQNLLLCFGFTAVREFGDRFLSRLVLSLWDESRIVYEGRAEELFASSLGDGGREWLSQREEF